MHRLPRISGKEAVKALVKKGFELRRQVGSHMILKRDSDGKRISVPNHPELPKGTLIAIIREADLTVEEFIELL